MTLEVRKVVGFSKSKLATIPNPFFGFDDLPTNGCPPTPQQQQTQAAEATSPTLAFQRQRRLAGSVSEGLLPGFVDRSLVRDFFFVLVCFDGLKVRKKPEWSRKRCFEFESERRVRLDGL